MSIKVIGVGDNVVDKYMHTKTMYPGGNAFNFSAYATMLGCPSSYMGVFGNDEAAAHVQATAKELGIDTSQVRIIEKSLLERYNSQSTEKITPVSTLDETPVSATLGELSLIEVTEEQFQEVLLSEAISEIADKVFPVKTYEGIRDVIKSLNDSGHIKINSSKIWFLFNCFQIHKFFMT